MKNGALRWSPIENLNNRRTGPHESTDQNGFPTKKVEVSPMLHPVGPAILRMYTEEEVADILQVSLSQLRKWRMKQHSGKHSGPPFRKLGRLVRYPGEALQSYINGD